MCNVAKDDCHPELLKQMVLQILNNIPAQDFIIYTDGNILHTDRAGSIYSNTCNGGISCGVRNLDHCFVFRLERIAISKALVWPREAFGC